MRGECWNLCVVCSAARGLWLDPAQAPLTVEYMNMWPQLKSRTIWLLESSSIFIFYLRHGGRASKVQSHLPTDGIPSSTSNSNNCISFNWGDRRTATVTVCCVWKWSSQANWYYKQRWRCRHAHIAMFCMVAHRKTQRPNECERLHGFYYYETHIMAKACPLWNELQLFPFYHHIIILFCIWKSTWDYIYIVWLFVLYCWRQISVFFFHIFCFVSLIWDC